MPALTLHAPYSCGMNASGRLADRPNEKKPKVSSPSARDLVVVAHRQPERERQRERQRVVVLRERDEGRRRVEAEPRALLVAEVGAVGLEADGDRGSGAEVAAPELAVVVGERHVEVLHRVEGAVRARVHVVRQRRLEVVREAHRQARVDVGLVEVARTAAVAERLVAVEAVPDADPEVDALEDAVVTALVEVDADLGVRLPDEAVALLQDAAEEVRGGEVAHQAERDPAAVWLVGVRLRLGRAENVGLRLVGGRRGLGLLVRRPTFPGVDPLPDRRTPPGRSRASSTVRCGA